ncbi:D-alanyl-D-alanine carboxypeptidase [Lentilactobacillus kosonis]|uniref:D-alanyl-D-alanine carboxypeptidase n=1 Tax=Lentilactobacillus kosonis TaxID=2810561 RepID=A0A401FHY6_9LACO|nr:serine hydrolase [Lentilactobacillus kosonis]GAY71983.1 D-alanyl-D-alanine carboxypeptidase [Lentilactobacillus kosonis]
MPAGVRADAQTTNDSRIQARAALAVDADTGQILYSQNAKRPLAIASISKLMTVYIVHQQIAAHKLSWNTPVKIGQNVAKLSTAAELTNVPLVAGRTYTVKALVQAALISSANAAAVALGNAVAGSPEQFNQVMQQTAKSMGIRDAQFYNAAGLPNKLMGNLELANVSPNAENMMSARSVGIIAANLLKSFPKVTQITSQTNFPLQERNMKVIISYWGLIRWPHLLG